MKLTKMQKATIMCHVVSGVRINTFDEKRLAELASVEIKLEQVDEHRCLMKQTLAVLDPTFEKALVVLVSEPRNHLGMTEMEMAEAKANGKIVYTPIETKDGKHVKTSDGTIYSKGKNGTLTRAIKKESKKEKRARRKKERIAAGKGR